MMPLASECCKCSKLLVDLLLEPYSDCTRDTGILKNSTVAIIAIQGFLSVYQSWTIIIS